MKEQRSGSQVLFGFLPEQTVDLRGRVWKVQAWQQPLYGQVEDSVIRREVQRQAAAWARNERDGGYVRDLLQGRPLDILTLNFHAGVRVEPFPRIWICKACNRAVASDEQPCRCGRRTWGQFHFVGYHECGALKAPYLPKCPTHDQVRIVFPGTSSAAEIRLDCPEPACGRRLRKGLGMPNCDCGRGKVIFTVHRAAAVYTPRSVVVVNPPTPERVRELRSAGGPARALEWILDGMTTGDYRQVGLTRSAFLQDLLDKGLDRSLAESLTQQAVSSGQVRDTDPAHTVDLPEHSRLEAEDQATVVATALVESRLRINDLISDTKEDSDLGRLYRNHYLWALDEAQLEAIELVDRFPVLTGNFAYTRGDSTPGAARLVPFRNGPRNYAVYADISETEALFVRLRPSRVAAWLHRRGFTLPDWDDERSARHAILEAVSLPAPGDDPPQPPTSGSALLTLVHSYAHRFVRRASVYAGIERTALAELLVPLHLGFFVYAAARGDFVLGGLQAVFETDLHQLVDDVVASEHRCALDPACQDAGGACAACLHLGEPSCRWFNRFLDRSALHGPDGYLTL